MKNLLVKTHEAWLATLMAAFMSKTTENKRVLTEFSDILWRHFTWIENDLINKGIDYDYDRENIPVKVERLSVMIGDIVRRMNDLEMLLVHCDDEALKNRIRTDLEYMRYALGTLEDEEVTAFDMSRTYRDIELDKEATDALTLFLFEESYKEYELIMIYNYLKAHSDDAFLNRIFQILIDESFFHLRSFGEMMAEMGILGVPRVIHQSLYKVSDIKKFLLDGIEEEIAAKEQCKELSDAVASKSAELAKFFDFINYQENYHIELMRDAVEHFRKRQADG
jgi:rubrerythrin/TusA-related sulfurtransferase